MIGRMAHPLWQEICPQLLPTQVEKLDRFLDLLIEWNQKLNLTRIVDRTDAEVKHIADALTAVAHIGPGLSVADVGTGGGVPGVPIAIARPDLRVTLVDSTRKKLDAIEQIVKSIGLTNVNVLHARIEAVDRTFDVVTARAVADLRTLLQWCDRLMHRQSLLIAMKGPRFADELAALPVRLARRYSIDARTVGVDPLSGHVLLLIRKVVP
jgi:16S rRNA (guanine527-N7)-methyltransferase